jgi:integrase
MAKNFLTFSRHGTIYYFRRRVPDDLKQIIGKPYLVKSLETSCRCDAIILARAYAAKTDAIYRHLRDMKKQKIEGFEVDYTLELVFDDLGSVHKIRVDANPDESEAVESAIRTTLQNLPNQAEKATRRELTKPQISADDLLDDFFREGIGAERWRDPETTRRHDYDPIWTKFSIHAKKHGLTLEAAKEYRAKVLEQESSYETKHRNLYRVHAVIVHGVDHHDLDVRMLKQFKMPKVNGQTKNSRTKNYLPFTSEELILLFQSTAYRQNSFKKPSHFWLPMLGLYTGARLEELAGLHLSAFTTVDEISAMVLSDDETTDGGKNEHALRQVPIHQELINAGLLQYVEQLRAEGHERLFPDIGKAARDGFGKRATVDFTEYRRSVSVGKGEGERSRQVFHSFRSTLAVKFFHLGVDGDLSRRLTGHAAIDVHQGTYLGAASIPMKRAAEAMSKISFNLDHPRFADTAAYVKTRRRARRSLAT